jgi:hypothetical protein
MHSIINDKPNLELSLGFIGKDAIDLISKMLEKDPN